MLLPRVGLFQIAARRMFPCPGQQLPRSTWQRAPAEVQPPVWGPPLLGRVGWARRNSARRASVGFKVFNQKARFGAEIDLAKLGKACFPALSYNASIWVGITTGVIVMRTAWDQNIGMSKSFCNVRDRVARQPPPQFCALQRKILQGGRSRSQSKMFPVRRVAGSRFSTFAAQFSVSELWNVVLAARDLQRGRFGAEIDLAKVLETPRKSDFDGCDPAIKLLTEDTGERATCPADRGGDPRTAPGGSHERRLVWNRSGPFSADLEPFWAVFGYSKLVQPFGNPKGGPTGGHQQVRFAPFWTVLSRFEPFSAGLEPF